MKKRILVVMIAGVFAVVLAAVAGTPPTKVTFEAKLGKVTFDHAAHTKKLGPKKCNVCHHTAKIDGSNAAKCSSCHQKAASEKDGKKVPKLKDAMHKTCKDCHKKEKKGPTKCKECHKK